MVVKITSLTIPKIEAVYFCTVLVLAGTNGRRDEKQLIDLEWTYIESSQNSRPWRDTFYPSPDFLVS